MTGQGGELRACCDHPPHRPGECTELRPGSTDRCDCDGNSPTVASTGQDGEGLVSEEMAEKAARAEWTADLDGQPATEEGWRQDRAEYVRSMWPALAAVAPDIAAQARRECAEEHLAAIEYLLSAYPAEVFPPDSDSRDAIAGTALRTVLTANLKHWRAEWSAGG